MEAGKENLTMCSCLQVIQGLPLGLSCAMMMAQRDAYAAYGQTKMQAVVPIMQQSTKRKNCRVTQKPEGQGTIAAVCTALNDKAV